MQEMVAGVDDRDERTLRVATGDDGTRLGLAVDMRQHPMVELAELLAVGQRLALVAQRNAEGDGLAPDREDRIPDLLRAVALLVLAAWQAHGQILPQMLRECKDCAKNLGQTWARWLGGGAAGDWGEVGPPSGGAWARAAKRRAVRESNPGPPPFLPARA